MKFESRPRDFRREIGMWRRVYHKHDNTRHDTTVLMIYVMSLILYTVCVHILILNNDFDISLVALALQ